jgi:hypothetical protein
MHGGRSSVSRPAVRDGRDAEHYLLANSRTDDASSRTFAASDELEASLSICEARSFS